MANPEHLKILEQGVEVWNRWREEESPYLKPDLRYAYLPRANLSEANLSYTDLSETFLHTANLSKANLYLATLPKATLYWANLEGANFSCADLTCANLSYSNLSEASLHCAQLSEARLRGSDLTNADLSYAKLFKADLTGTKLIKANFSGVDLSDAALFEAKLVEAKFFDANLTNANLSGSVLYRYLLIETNLTGAKLINARIYGISAWNLKKEGLIQKDLIITPPGEPEITVDDLEVAQFIYLMLNNQKIRDVIETITSKAVLILGRFTPERKAVLEALKDELRRRNYLPIVFDFENTENRSLTETVSLLAKMSKFVIADITDAKGIIHELREIVPMNSSLPIRPLILKSKKDEEYAFFKDFKHHHWLLPLYEYESPETLLDNIIPAIITPAEQKVAELRGK